MLSFTKNEWRTHACGLVGLSDVGGEVVVSGFLHNKRDHGGVLFVDVRDASGLLQSVVEDQETIDAFAKVRLESVVCIKGVVRARPDGSANETLASGKVELVVSSFVVESEAEQIPFQVNEQGQDGAAGLANEDLRLRYRFLDLRRSAMRDRIILRSRVALYVRQMLSGEGFLEVTTPILTSSSPEGARDFIVPSRLHPGKFYALPQAPQQFKQILMMSGLERYFQIAPCFRDEDSRADRSPGEFYQIDIEMAFATQEDVFAVVERLICGIFGEFSGKGMPGVPFRRIAYDECMLSYGNDKPDLRNPIINKDVGHCFDGGGFSLFAKAIAAGGSVRAIPAPGAAGQPRSFFDKMIDFAVKNGAGGLAYIIFEGGGAKGPEGGGAKGPEGGGAKGPVAKFLTPDRAQSIKDTCEINDGDCVFFACGEEGEANRIAGLVRNKLGEELELIDRDQFCFCWVTDFPFYERDSITGQIAFSHNPFSMPQGGMQALLNEDPLSIKAFQYDLVCNGIELSSGAIRNHKLDVMYKAFEIAGYSKEEVNERFAAMVKSFSYGAPPHGGIAPGLDRIIMLLADTENIRDVIAFPLNGKAEDLLMGAPSTVSDKQLKEVGISVKKNVAK